MKSMMIYFLIVLILTSTINSNELKFNKAEVENKGKLD